MKLVVQKRDVFQKAVKHLRKESKIPGIIYGKHLPSAISILFDKNSFIKTYKAVGDSTPMDLSGDGVDNMVLVHDIHTHPVTSELLHVDFLAVRKDQKVEAQVSIILEGTAPIEKDNLGRVQIIKDHITVEAYPQDLPHHVSVDVSTFARLDDGIFVKDLKLGDKVEIKEDPEQPVVVVVEIREEKVEEMSAEEAASAAAGSAATDATEKKEEEKK